MSETKEPLSARLDQAQARARSFRAEALVSYSPIVCGERLKPITLETYNALCAFGNAFVTGGAIGFEDIANFIWLHSPHFGQFNRREKRDLTRRVMAWLTPKFARANEVLRFAAQLPRLRWIRHFTATSEAERIAAAVSEIRRLIDEATADLPAGDDKGEPLPFAFGAYILNLFRRDLGMSFEETLSLPLKQVAQHFREIVYTASRGKAILLTNEEAAIWREHLGGSDGSESRAG